MSQTDLDDPTPLATRGIRGLLHRIWVGVRNNRALVVAMVIASLAEALLTKAPFLLVKPLFDSILVGDAVAPPPADPAEAGGSMLDWLDVDERFAGWFVERFETFAVWLTGAIGLDFGEQQVAKAIVVTCAIVAIGIGLLGAVAIYFASLLNRYFAAKIVVDLRNEIADHILRLPLRYFGRRRMGELISRLTNDTTVLTRSFTLVADHALVDPLSILVNIGMIGLVVPWALVLFVPAILLMALPMVRLGKKVHKRSRGSLAAMGDATESMNQMLSGIKVVKAFQLEDVRMREFAANNQQYLQRTRRMLQAKGRSQAIVFASYQLAFAGVVILLGWLLISGGYTAGDMGLVLLPIATTYQHIKRAARVYNTLMESVGAMDGIEAILAENHDAAVGPGRTLLADVRGRVELERVSFAYDDEAVLRDVSFTVEPGQTVALVGPSGAGKSTCLDLIARFHDPTSGRILIDGHDLREVDLGSFRRRVAMVAQQPFLFNATIYDNIACGRPGASRDEVVEAARKAHIHDFVASLPDGYDTLCGERGSNLSGGQMQRITIARAIVRDPAVLFLDEATSALDSESEGAVQAALRELMRGRTSLVIAHRLSTIRDADRILVFREGRLVESGRHDDLMQAGAAYRRMVELQELG